MHWLLPRGKLFILLPLALAVFAMVRYSVIMNESPAVRGTTITTIHFDHPQQFQEGSTKSSQSNDKDESGTTSSIDDVDDWERNLSPKVIWLTSYPNSGTSYTMTLVERASQLSTASNYGVEVTYKREDSLPIYPNHPEGPFWDGLSGKMGTPRPLPTTNVLTKTHCGGRCVKCSADEYVIDTITFLRACQRTTHRVDGENVESLIPASIVAGMVHLIRNPYHNTVARFHLERRNMISKNEKLEKRYPLNAVGFQKWCKYLDDKYSSSDEEMFPETVRNLFDNVPCYGEFYKWTQWHNLALSSATLLGFPDQRPVPIHTVWYEHYHTRFNQTFAELMQYINVPIAATQFQSFRSLPTYSDHYTSEQRTAIQTLIQHVALPELWKLISHYFVDDDTTLSSNENAAQ